MFTELECDLESFVVNERIKIQDDCSQLAVSKVLGSSGAGKRDRIQQMIDSWSNAFLQVSLCFCVCNNISCLVVAS